MAGGYSLVLARREGARLRILLDNLLGLILMAGGYSLVLVVAPDAREFYRCLPLFLMAGRELAYACGSTICRGYSPVFAIAHHAGRVFSRDCIAKYTPT